jgi:hypothetical protein
LFYPEQFAPLFKPVRPDLPITIVPGAGHSGIDGVARGYRRVRKSFVDMTEAAKS